MGVVGAPGGAREGRQQWEEVDSGAPGRGGQGEGLERVSGPLSAAPGPQDSSLPSQDTSLCLPTSTLHPAPGLAGKLVEHKDNYSVIKGTTDMF